MISDILLFASSPLFSFPVPKRKISPVTFFSFFVPLQLKQFVTRVFHEETLNIIESPNKMQTENCKIFVACTQQLEPGIFLFFVFVFLLP